MYYMDNKLMALAVIPGLLILLYVYGKDKVEKEPLSMILKLLLFGAITTEIAAVAEGALMQILPHHEPGTIQYAVQTSFCIAAFCEEIVKYLALRIGSWRSRYFNYRFDGVVYGVSAALGFAILENIMYVAQYGIATAITRAVLAVPLHAFCGVFMGVFYSYSKKASILGMNGTSARFTLLALLVPMMIHGFYDTCAFMGNNSTFTVILLIFVAFLYFVSISTIRKLSAEDRHAGFYPEARVIEYDSTLTE